MISDLLVVFEAAVRVGVGLLGPAALITLLVTRRGGEEPADLDVVAASVEAQRAASRAHAMGGRAER